MSSSRDPLGAALGPRLRAADPLRGLAAPQPTPDGLASAFAELAAGTPSRARSTSRLPRRRMLVVAATCVALAIPSAAIGGYLGVHSGFFAGEHQTEDVAGEEYLNLASPRIVPVVRALTRDVPLPAGMTWDALLARYPAAEGLMQRRGIGFDVESYARCHWQTAWLAAETAGDRSAMKQAAQILTESATWPYTVASDGGGVVASLRRSAAAARSGDARAVREAALAC